MTQAPFMKMKPQHSQDATAQAEKEAPLHTITSNSATIQLPFLSFLPSILPIPNNLKKRNDP